MAPFPRSIQTSLSLLLFFVVVVEGGFDGFDPRLSVSLMLLAIMFLFAVCYSVHFYLRRKEKREIDARLGLEGTSRRLK